MRELIKVVKGSIIKIAEYVAVIERNCTTKIEHISLNNKMESITDLMCIRSSLEKILFMNIQKAMFRENEKEIKRC